MKKRILTTIIIALFFLTGLSLLLYPLVANEWNNYRQSRLISSYDEAVSEQETSGEIDYTAEWEKANAFNEALLPSILPDSFAVAAASDEDSEDHQAYMSCLNLLGDGMMGYVEVPKINIKIPIYHTTDEEVLEQAAGHLEGSSLPVGGENTHAVISAHRDCQARPCLRILTNSKKEITSFSTYWMMSSATRSTRFSWSNRTRQRALRFRRGRIW